jgi:hypothetical protein
MAGPLRIEFPDALCHVIPRGNERCPGVRDDEARALAAHLRRVRFGYRATAVAEHLGYGGPSSVSHAVRRIGEAPERLRAIAARLDGKLI